ncbi:g257 [Coccomyxa elongata]
MKQHAPAQHKASPREPASSRGLSVKRPLQKPLEQAITDGNWRETVALVEKLLLIGSVPDNIASDHLLKGLCGRGAFRTAWKLYKSEQGQSRTYQYSTYQALITSAFQAGEPYDAVQAFRDLQQSGLTPNVITWSSMISSLCKQRRKGAPFAQLAYKLWKELEASGLATGNAALYAAGMNASVGLGYVDEAAKLLRTMQSSGMRADVRAYNILLKGYASARELGAMQATLAEMERLQVAPSLVTYNILIDAFVNEGRLEQAAAKLKEAQRLGLRLDVWSYNTLIKGYCLANEAGNARDVLEAMKLQNVQPNVITYTTLVDGCVRAGDLFLAEEVLRDMQFMGVPPNTVTFNIMLRGYCKSSTRPIQDAISTLRSMGMAGVVPSTDTFNTLMSACLSKGDPGAVPRLFRRLISLGHTPDALSYTSLITSLTRLGRPEDAVLAFRAMEADARVAVDVAALNAAVDALARCGRMGDAERQLDHAMQLCERQGRQPPLEAYGALLAEYARRRDAEAALSVLRDFFERGGTPDDQMFDTVMDLCMRTGEFRRAMQVIRAMERVGQQVDKGRIKRALEDLLRQQSKLQGRQRKRSRNEGLERLKFWLGIPNNYYESDWQVEQAQKESEEST